MEAAEFYVSVFPDFKVNFKTQIKDTPSGDCDIVGFEVMVIALWPSASSHYLRSILQYLSMLNLY